MRIVSLLPAATEICFALGLGSKVVGVSPECDAPPAARAKPVVSRTLLRSEDMPSAETSQRVGERLAAGEALYDIDEAALQAAAPDLVLTQGLCEVCAPTLGDLEDVARRLPRVPSIVSLDPHHLEDMLQDIERLGRECGVEDRAADLVEALRDRIERVRRTASKAASRPGTVCLEWLDPLFLAGHWVPEMVELAGGHDVLGVAGEPSRRVDPDEIVIASPRVAVLMPCGFHIDRTRTEAPAVTGRTWWADLPAARADRVWIVDGSSYFNRPGPRLVDGLEILGHILHPESFPQPPRPADAQRWVA